MLPRNANNGALLEELPETFRDALKLPRLTAVEEFELAVIAERGGEAGRIARNTLVNRNLRLCVKIAGRYASFGVDLADLIQEGNLGLLEAAEKFSAQFKVRFGAYACWWIRQKILRALGKLRDLWQIRLEGLLD